MEGKTCKFELASGPTDFRSIVVKVYLIKTPSNEAKDFEHVGLFYKDKIPNEAVSLKQ